MVVLLWLLIGPSPTLPVSHVLIAVAVALWAVRGGSRWRRLDDRPRLRTRPWAWAGGAVLLLHAVEAFAIVAGGGPEGVPMACFLLAMTAFPDALVVDALLRRTPGRGVRAAALAAVATFAVVVVGAGGASWARGQSPQTERQQTIAVDLASAASAVGDHLQADGRLPSSTQLAQDMRRAHRLEPGTRVRVVPRDDAPPSWCVQVTRAGETWHEESDGQPRPGGC